MKTIQGNLNVDKLRFGIIVARFNEFIGSRLLSGAMDALTRHGAEENLIETTWVPGAFEIPLMAKRMAKSGKYDALICLGAVIRGDTPHFNFIASEAAKGIAMVSLQTEVPISFGILTTDNIEQAIERAGTKNGNKGFDAAMTAIEMANLMKEF